MTVLLHFTQGWVNSKIRYGREVALTWLSYGLPRAYRVEGIWEGEKLKAGSRFHKPNPVIEGPNPVVPSTHVTLSFVPSLYACNAHYNNTSPTSTHVAIGRILLLYLGPNRSPDVWRESSRSSIHGPSNLRRRKYFLSNLIERIFRDFFPPNRHR